MAEQDSGENRGIDQSIDMIYDAFMRLDKEKENEALKQWCLGVCQPELAVIDGFVANFVNFVDDKEYSRKLLKVLK